MINKTEGLLSPNHSQLYLMNTKNSASFFLEFFFYRYMISYKKKITLFNKQLKIQGHVCCELFNLTCVNIPDTHLHNVPVNAT